MGQFLKTGPIVKRFWRLSPPKAQGLIKKRPVVASSDGEKFRLGFVCSHSLEDFFCPVYVFAAPRAPVLPCASTSSRLKSDNRAHRCRPVPCKTPSTFMMSASWFEWASALVSAEYTDCDTRRVLQDVDVNQHAHRDGTSEKEPSGAIGVLSEAP